MNTINVCSLNAEDPEDKRQMQLDITHRSKEVTALRLKALHLLSVLIMKDELVAVKFFKLKIISNLVRHTLVQNAHPVDFKK